jgi:hypothetical protein
MFPVVTRWSRWFNLFYPVVLALMIGCIAFAVIGWTEMLLGNQWSGLYLVIACVLLALEGIYSEQFVQHIETDSHPFALITEMILLIIALRLIRYAGLPILEARIELEALIAHPVRFFDLEFFAGIGAGFVAWYASLATMFEIQAAGSRPELYRDMTSPVRRLMTRFCFGGILLMLTTALITLTGHDPMTSGYPLNLFILNAALYAALGLLMLNQVRAKSAAL